MSKGSPISPSLMATKSAGAPKAPERVERPADAAVDIAAVSPVLGPNNVVPPTVMTGSQAIVRSLEELGVDDIFGLPGGAILPTYDPLMASRMNHILVRHEQGAGHAAQGYAMVTGRVGVCIATSGPGATNLVTAITDAHMDSVPIVAITGQVSSGDRHRRVPGSRHRRHHHADHEALLPGHATPTTSRTSSPRRSTSPPPAVPAPCSSTSPRTPSRAR